MQSPVVLVSAMKRRREEEESAIEKSSLRMGVGRVSEEQVFWRTKRLGCPGGLSGVEQRRRCSRQNHRVKALRTVWAVQGLITGVQGSWGPSVT